MKPKDKDANAEPKRRGRKVTEPNKYFAESQEKIDEWKKILDRGRDDNGRILTKKQKEGLRNRISAQESRRKKKLELQTLKEKQAKLEKDFKIILDALDEVINEEDKEKVTGKLLRRIPEKAFLKSVPQEDRFTITLQKFMKLD